MSRLATDVRPERYSLHLDVDPRRASFTGELALELHAPVGTRTLELHAVDLEIAEPSVADAEGEIEVRGIKADAKRQTVRLTLARGLRSSAATLRLRYTGPLRSDLRGLYLARSGRRRYAATQLEAADARRFFPCFDEPDKKARFKLSVATPARNQVVSNAPELRKRRAGAKVVHEFAETPPLSTYLVALIVGELEASPVRRCGTTPIRVWCVPGKRKLAGFALDAAAESLARLERYFGLPYPYAKLDLIAVPDFEFGAMENAGAVTFRETLLLVDPKTVTLSEKKRVAEVIAHELAHMWFGDLVTMAWWDDLWLNEAFATWMAFAIVDDWQPDWKMWLDFQHHRSAAYGLDALKSTHPIYTEVRTPDEATENFDLITYEKGASVVRMLERWLGAAEFRRGVRSYIRKHRESNARAADLWTALEEVSGKPVGPILKSWLERPGFPLLDVSLTERDGKPLLHCRQERCFLGPKHFGSDPEALWTIPAVLRVRPKSGRARLQTALLDAREQDVALGSDAPRWVYANAEESGFYRPLHDPALLAALRPDLGQLDTAERMGLLSHQWAGLRAGRASLAAFLDLASALGEEHEPEVLEALFGPLAWLKAQAVPTLPERDRGRFADWLVSTFLPAFEQTGFTPRRGEGDAAKLRRSALLTLLGGIAEHPATVAEAEARADAYVKDRRSLDSNLAGPVVHIAARPGNKSRYEAYLRTVRRAATPQERQRFELALAAFRDPALVQRTLSLLLTEEIPTQDVVPVIGQLLDNAHAREAAWQFVRDRWNDLSPRISTGLASRLVSGLSALQTRAARKEVAQFFRAHPLPSAARALRQTLERFDLDAELRRRAGPELRAWLR